MALAKKVGAAKASAPAAKRGRGRPKGSTNKAKTSVRNKVKGATRKAKSKVSLKTKRDRILAAVRALRARKRKAGLTYNAKARAWVPYKSKATKAAALRRSGKRSPLWNKRPPKGFKAALAKRKRTLAVRVAGKNKDGRKRLPRVKGGRVGKRPAVTPRSKKASKVAKSSAATRWVANHKAKASAPAAKRGRGRPKGSKNKAK